MTNFKLCLINTIDELENVFADTGIMLDFGHAVDNEMMAVEVVERVLNEIDGDKWL